MFSRQVENEVKTLFASSNDVFGKTFTYDQLGHLPEPVLRYFKYSLQEGQHYVSYVKPRHGGTFRQNEG